MKYYTNFVAHSSQSNFVKERFFICQNLNFYLVGVLLLQTSYKRKFVKVVLWVLSLTTVAINSIQYTPSVSVGNVYAKDFFDKLLSFGVIGDIGKKGRRKVLPQSIEEISSDLKDFLSHQNISDDKILDAISKRVMTSEQRKGTKQERTVN